MAAGRPRVSGLFVHPLKACGAVALQRMELDAHGPAGDRRFLVVDAKGRFVTQRELPVLATVRCRLRPASIELEAAGQPPLEVPLAGRPGDRVPVVCWLDSCDAIDQGDAAAAWLTRHAERPLRLVRLMDDAPRAVDPRFAPRAGSTTSFTDGYPLLVVSEASLFELNRRLAPGTGPLPMGRFRPNLVVRGCDAFAEDEWRHLRVLAPDGSPRLELDVVKPCSRCAVTTTDQQTAERGPEPLRTLASFRRFHLAVDDSEGDRSAVFFGQNAVHRTPGTIELGDTIEVLESGKPRFSLPCT